MSEATLQNIKNALTRRVDVLDKGWIELLDILPHPNTDITPDMAVVQAARVSFRGDSKGEEADKKLLFYLLRNAHCYRGDMQVLTIEGWKRWDECGSSETFVVPDPSDKTVRLETLPVKMWQVEDETMYNYDNQRMSYSVSHNHTMRFANKDAYRRHGDDAFETYKIQDMAKWGYFDSVLNYEPYVSSNVREDSAMWLLGFFFGDGNVASAGTIRFHLKKARKVAQLLHHLSALDYTWHIVEGSNSDVTITIDYPQWFDDYQTNNRSNSMQRASNKAFEMTKLAQMSSSQLKGLWLGLIDSDGHYSKGRTSQIQFSSKSKDLVELFDTLAVLCGYDAHGDKSYDGVYQITAYDASTRTTLESRKEYHSTEQFTGNIYCTTTSTGWLLVRGGNDKYAFVCGNTSPFEMVEFKFRVRAPLITWWQWARHRTWNFNAQSGRYTPFEENDFHVPTEWRKQSESNKQASSGEVLGRDDAEKLAYMVHQVSPELANIWEDTREDGKLEISDLFESYSDLGYKIYQSMLELGAAKEQARLFLPAFGIYYTWVAKIDAHNLMQFLRLRMDNHAQYEIRAYAQAIYENYFKVAMPWTAEAFHQYVLKP